MFVSFLITCLFDLAVELFLLATFLVNTLTLEMFRGFPI